MGWLGYGIVGLVAYVVFVLAQMPAAQVYDWFLREATPLELYGVEGTVWSGKATGGRYRELELPAVSWRWQPTGLMRGALAYGLWLEAPDTQAYGQVYQSWNGTVAVTDLVLPLPMVQPFLAPLVPRLEGIITGELTIRFREPIPWMAGAIRWEQAVIHTGHPAPLGTLDAVLRTEEGEVIGEFASQEGPLGLQGTLRVSAQGKYRIAGAFQPTQALDSDLRQLLDAFGQSGSSGRVAFDFSGQLATNPTLESRGGG